MKGEFGMTATQTTTPEEESDFEIWSEETFKRRCEELQLVDLHPKNTNQFNMLRSDSRCEETDNYDHHDRSPSRSTTSESQVST